MAEIQAAKKETEREKVRIFKIKIMGFNYLKAAFAANCVVTVTLCCSLSRPPQPDAPRQH